MLRLISNKINSWIFRVVPQIGNSYPPPPTNQAVRGRPLYVHLNGLAITYS